MFTVTGEVEVPLDDFYAWLHQYTPVDPKLIDSGSIVFGKPRYCQDNGTLQIPFAAGSDSHPLDWTDCPEFLSHLPKPR